MKVVYDFSGPSPKGMIDGAIEFLDEDEQEEIRQILAEKAAKEAE